MNHEIFTPSQCREVMSRLRQTMLWINGRRLLSAGWFSMEELCNGEWRFTADSGKTGWDSRSQELSSDEEMTAMPALR